MRRSPTERQLVCRAPLHDQRRFGGVSGQSFVLDESVRRPLRGPPVTRLGAGPEGMDAASGVEHRQAGKRRLQRIDVEIWAGRARACEGHARTARHRQLPGDRDDRIQHEIGDDPVVTSETLPDFGARAQPWHPPIFGKDARLDGPTDPAEAAQGRFVRFAAPRSKLTYGPELKIAGLEQCNSGAVARAAEALRSADPAEVE